MSEPTIKALHELNGDFFTMNRYWDATVSVLGVDFACNVASKLLHHYVAHWYPQAADILNEKCLENFNIKAYYPATPAGDVAYVDLVDMMKQMLDRTINFQNKFMGARKVANDCEDFSIVVELDKILIDLNKQVAQMILIYDKAQLYKNNYTSFDRQFPSFFTLNEDEGD